jgi:GxxExxY protein
VPEKIIHKDLSYLVNGCIFDVHNEVGPGLREECYQKTLEHRLNQAGLPFVSKPRTRRELIYRGVAVDLFEGDLIVAERIILELKHQPDGLARENFVQLLNYLKFWNVSLGLLVNFALDRAIIERVPYEPRHAQAEEEYDHIAELISSEQHSVWQTIREALLVINAEIGLGYSTPTCRNLVITEFQSRGLHCSGQIEVNPTFRDCRLPNSRISPLVVNDMFCVEVEAIYDEISARAVRTMQTHLRVLNREIGLVVGFGKTRFMIRGVRKGGQRI